MALHPPADLLRVVEVEPLLELAEARLAGLVEADDLAVDDRRRPEDLSEALRDLGEPRLLRFVVSAEECQLVAVEAREDTKAIEFRFEGPVGVVEGGVDERAKHGGVRVRHRRGRHVRIG